MFKKGQRVYSILRGWGEVTDDSSLELDKYPIEVSYNGAIYYYMRSGKYLEEHLIPELYHAEPVITVPKRRVEHTGWVQISNYEDCDKRQCSAFIFDSKELLDKSYSDKGTYIKQQITYYTEE